MTHCLQIGRLTRVEQDDSFKADKFLRFEFEHAEAGSSGQQHVKDLSHALNTVSFTPGKQNVDKLKNSNQGYNR